MENKKRRIFLSYSHADRDKAMLIANRLSQTGLEIITDYKDLSFEKNIFDEIRYLFESSDFVIVLLSKSLFQSEFFKFEYTNEFFINAKRRKITLLPVLIEKCDIPSDFLEFEIFNLYSDLEKGFDKLLHRIKVIPEISFDNFNYKTFESLTYDLLKSYGFFNIQTEARLFDKGIDFMAEYLSRNPFGQRIKEQWMIEAKFYSESRFDIKAIKQLVDLYKYVNRQDAKLLLVTNSQLNSVVEDYLEELKRTSFIDIVVIDGLLLKKLIANKRSLLNKYFLK
jgi:hypothetical protein